ncbi:DUF3592 domain-containing protein [Cyanobium sp. AMD-g]|uniref:DUF3592 domain-containing protein n=1 Tax=Cyanobium sp. AMD-g TaxID=2823699 RepID=UPI0020CEA62C|nr:DUF3592 domain-containing protein [Cyanobium sp. AMD-g]MCP9929224.1 DUF3592 domain-containing protein [Cyanobium sp. AMD-g]
MVFATITFLTGIAFVALGLWLRDRSQQARQWPRMKGHVIGSRVDDTDLETMKPVLRYRYEVGGEIYIDYRVSSKNPAAAVLDNTAPSDWLSWLIFGVGILALAAHLAWR